MLSSAIAGDSLLWGMGPLKMVFNSPTLIGPCETRLAKTVRDSGFSSRRRIRHGDLTDLICLEAMNAAYRDLEEARLKHDKAVHRLVAIRETLDRAVDIAYRRQSFGPIEELFSEEETALSAYEQAVATLNEAERRWLALKVALAYEKELMLAGTSACKRLN